jgi:hypothetical protein
MVLPVGPLIPEFVPYRPGYSWSDRLARIDQFASSRARRKRTTRALRLCGSYVCVAIIPCSAYSMHRNTLIQPLAIIPHLTNARHAG